MASENEFKDGTALVFGGSGGLGSGICKVLAAHSSDVSLTYNKNKDTAVETASAFEAAVRQLVQAVAREEGEAGIRANFIPVGLIDAGLALTIDTPEVLATLLRASPLGRMGRTDEIGEAVAFLTSNKSSYLSGQSLAVDGGFTA